MRCPPCLLAIRLNSTDSMTDPVDYKLELQEIAAESIGWIPLDEGVYLHVSDENATEVLVVGVPQAGAAVLLVI